MSDNCKIAHPLKREGTYQWQRLAEGLKDGYFKPDDRRIEDIVKQIAEYASTVRYYNEDLNEWGNWEAFFEYLYDYRLNKLKFTNIDTLLADGNVPPHLGLMLAFLKTFDTVRNEFNHFTGKHLDFYYHDVLQLAKKAAVPDKVAMLFIPEKNTVQAKVEAGRALNGGKDATKKDRIYKTTKEIIVNQVTVAQKKSIYADKDINTASLKGLHTAEDASIENAVIQNNTTSWFPFGSASNKLADIGFAITSPLLLAKEGRRRLSIELEGNGTIPRTALKALYTGPKGWEEAEVDIMPGINYNSSSTSRRFLLIKINESMPAIVAYDEKNHQSNINTIYPVVKILLKNDTSFPQGYDFFSAIKLNNLNKIRMNVEGVQSFTITNENGKLNPLQAFKPFGSLPVKNKSFFIIGHNEAFNKYLKTFHLSMNWKGAPGNMYTYYKPYDEYLNAYGIKTYIGNTLVKNHNDPYTTFRQSFIDFNQGNVPGKTELLSGGKWVKVIEDTGSNYTARSSKTMNTFHAENITRDAFDIDNSKEYKSDSKYGFAKITLKHDFGHSLYASVLTDTVLYNTQHPSAPKAMPPAPYTPEFNSLELDYVLESTIDINNKDHQLIQLHPFGHKAIVSGNDTLISPDYNDNGQLYIGLGDCKSSQIINLYFARLDGTEDINASINEKIKCSYLAGDTWKECTFDQIVTDTTIGFTASGFFSLSIPQEAIAANTIMGQSLVWLKLTSFSSAAAYPAIIDILTNAVEARFEDNGNDPYHLQAALAAGSIAKPVIKIEGIKAIQQPFASYDGKMQEQDEQFYTRISERLRHKGRAWSIWDFERIILNKYPSIYKIKCLSHSLKEDMYAPGNVLCVVIPNLENIADKDLLQPRMSQAVLQSVKAYASQFMTVFANLEVINPVYETITVKCSVRIKKGFDETYYANQLNTDLQQYISPWIRNRNSSPSFGGKIYASAIINFIEELEYIDYLTFFSVTKLEANTLITWTEFTSGSSEDVILTSAKQHQIDTNAIC